MKKFMKVILFVLTIQVSTQMQAQINFAPVNSEEEWSEMLLIAKEANKPIFVDIYTDWCGYCKKMDKDVFSQNDVAELMNTNFVNVKVDGESGFGKAFANIHQVEGFPTYAFVDYQDDALAYLEGYNRKPEFVEASNGVAATHVKIREFDKRYLKENLKSKELIEYYSISVNQNRKEELFNRIFDTVDRDEDPSEDFVHFLASTNIFINDKAYLYIKKHRAIIREQHGDEEMQGIVNGMYENSLTKAIIENDRMLLDQVLEELIPTFLDEETYVVAQYDTKKFFNAYTNDWDAYRDIVMDRYKEMEGEEKDNFFYNEGLAIVNDFKESLQALQYADEWLLMNLKQSDDFESNLLIAYIKALLGEKEVSKKYLATAESKIRNEEDKGLVNNIQSLLTEESN